MISIQILTPAWLCSAVTTLLAISSSWTTRPCCCWTSGMICSTVTSSSLESSSREMFLALSWNTECLNSYSLITIILYHQLWGDRDRSERHHKECWLSLSLVMFPEIKMYRKNIFLLFNLIEIPNNVKIQTCYLKSLSKIIYLLHKYIGADYTSN